VVDFTIEFYEEAGGRQPFRQFLDDLDPAKRLSMIAAIEQILAKQGSAVCNNSWGKSLGKGLFEFRVRHTAAEIRRMFDGDPPPGPHDLEGPPGKVVLRVFCHAYGDRIVLLLGGYDKGEDASAKRQQKEIQTARKRLTAFQIVQQRAAKTKKR
jgi:putative component of toxin-antitoxin plasmid stabilization module